jgi:hypothetical protein
MQRSIWKPIFLATVLCGTLDIVFAMILTLMRGREIPNMLRFVASGPFQHATDWGASGAALVAWFMVAARNVPALTDKPWLAGLIYGLITWAVMNLIVVPLRFPAAWPPKPMAIATQLFAHIVLVGLPTAYIARRYLRG